MAENKALKTDKFRGFCAILKPYFFNFLAFLMQASRN